MQFTNSLQNKIAVLNKRRLKTQIGEIEFNSPLLFAPMSGISSAPYRYLMEMLGAGGTVSELISCHGINYKNEKTHEMLYIHPGEKNVGIQLFGGDKNGMAEAAKIAADKGPKFIDINMGCPVKKVVGTGAGSALLKDTSVLGDFFSAIKKASPIPVTIKIRTGWDSENINASEVIRIANEEGISFVAIHGRTRAQAYTGLADWSLIEHLGKFSPLDIIGNGDLNGPLQIKEKMNSTTCAGLMMGRGPLKNPFLFLAPYQLAGDEEFTLDDLFEVMQVLTELFMDMGPKHALMSFKKHVVWYLAGLPYTAQYKDQIFKAESMELVRQILNTCKKDLNDRGIIFHQEKMSLDFMTSGHG